MAKKKPKQKKKKMSNRYFFKTVVQVEVLSENPFEFTGLKDLDYLITQGHCVGAVRILETEELTGKETAVALMEQGHDPSFFHLTADGQDADER